MNDSEAPSSAAVSEALAKGVEFLRRRQLPTGEFPADFAWDADLKVGRRPDSASFPTPFVINALGFVEHIDIEEMVQRAVTFLLEEQERGGLWRYRTKRNPEYLRIPPDVDGTACICWTLRKLGVSFTANEKVLYRNRDGTGLFVTYIRPSSRPWAWLGLLRSKRWRQVVSWNTYYELSMFRNNVDLEVNANVVLYLGESEKTKPVCQRLAQAVSTNGGEDPSRFCADVLGFYYFVSRAYFYGISSLESTAAVVPDRIAQRLQRDGSFGNALNTALAACSLLNYGLVENATLKHAIRHTIAFQAADGSWPGTALYSGTFKRTWFGSEELTTAFCVEALARYRLDTASRASETAP